MKPTFSTELAYGKEWKIITIDGFQYSFLKSWYDEKDRTGMVDELIETVKRLREREAIIKAQTT